MPLHRKLSVACLAATALTSVPAMADDSAAADVAKRLTDPSTQVAVTVALAALSQALLDIKIDPLRRALEAAGSDGAADLPPDARLRDIAGPEAEQVAGEIGRRVPQAMGAAGDMAGAVEDLIPELEGMADKLKHAIPSTEAP